MCPPFRIYMYSFVLIRIFFIEIAYLDPEDERLLEEDLNTPTDSKRYERENERRENERSRAIFTDKNFKFTMDLQLFDKINFKKIF